MKITAASVVSAPVTAAGDGGEAVPAATRGPEGTPPAAGGRARRSLEVAPRRRRALLPRVPGLDGLRGIAVAAVVVYHFFGDALPGGYLGVDVFFVLSGFLITSLLARERAVTGRVDLKRFWLKRARRIFPAAVVVATVTAVVAGAVGGDRVVDLDRQYLTTLVFFNNWGQILASRSYFAEGGAEVFAHFWSLSVEEQFYLFWPLVLPVVWRVLCGGRLRAAAACCAVAAGLSALWMARLYAPAVDASRVYYGTDTHAFGLLLGAAAALWLLADARDGVIWRTPAGWASLPAALVVAVGFFVLADDSPAAYRGGVFVVSAATALVVAGVARGQRLLSGLLANPLLRRLGAVSFSLYLWHWPVVVILDEALPAWATATGVGIIALPVSYLLAELTYALIEEPFRRRGYRAVIGAHRRLVVPVAAVAVVAVAAALVHAPDKTRLQADLEAAAQRHGGARPAVAAGSFGPGNADDAQGAHPAREVADNGDGDAENSGGDAEVVQPRHLPGGEEITAIGDSVLLASADALEQAFPGIYIDGAVSRSWTAAPGIVAEMQQAGTLGRFVILGFGTNGASDGGGPGLLDDLLDDLGSQRTVVLVLPYGDRWYMPQAEEEIRRAARERDNVFVADWCHRAKDNPALLREDLIHPVPEGAVAYAEAVRDALEQWRDRRGKVPGVCGV